MRAALPVLLTLLALSPSLAAAPNAPPQFAVDDFWTYDIRPEGAADGDTGPTSRSRVAEIETRRFPDGPAEVARMETVLVTEPDGARVESNTTMWVRMRDGALLATRVVQTRYEDGRAVASIEQTTEYLRPCVGYDWPIEVGASWTTRCDVRRTTRAMGQPPTTQEDVEGISSRVLRNESVTVPAGTFDAFVIETKREGVEGMSLQWFAPAACQPVRVRAEGGGETILRAFRCQSGGHAASQPLAQADAPAPAAALVAAVVAIAALACAPRRSRR